MKKQLLPALLSALLAFGAYAAPPAPPEATTPANKAPAFPSDLYTVVVDGQDKAVYVGLHKNLGPYAFCGFDMDKPVTVKLTGPCDMTHTVIRPAGVRFTAKGNELTLTLDKPRKISIEPTGVTKKLLLFASAPATPPAASPSVIRLGPGVHRPKDGKIILTDNQTLWLDEGAILMGTVQARNAKNVHIAGRGIISGLSWGWNRGPSRFLVHFHDCKDSSIKGVTLHESFFWTLCIISCDRFEAKDLKIMCCRSVNTDGIVICNSRKVRVSDCFIHTYDDCITIKGIPSGNARINGYTYDWPPEREREPVEDVDISDCILWSSPCRGFIIGQECQAEHMRNIRFRDSEIIHHNAVDDGNPWLPFEIYVGENCPIENVSISNITVNAEDAKNYLVKVDSTGNEWQLDRSGGFLKGLVFKDIRFTGVDGQKIRLKGGNAAHALKSVSFENISVNGVVVDKDSPVFELGNHVKPVKVTAGRQTGWLSRPEVTAQSTFGYNNKAEFALDGAPATLRQWVSLPYGGGTKDKPLDVWWAVDFFEKPVTVSGVKIIGDPRNNVPLMKNFQIQSREAGVWKTIGEIKDAETKDVTVTFDGPVTAEALRLFVPAADVPADSMVRMCKFLLVLPDGTVKEIE